MPNLAIYLGYDRPAGTRQLAGTLPPLPIPGFIAGGCDRIPSKYGIPAISCLSVLLCRTATHSSCRHPPLTGFNGQRLVLSDFGASGVCVLYVLVRHLMGSAGRRAARLKSQSASESACYRIHAIICSLPGRRSARELGWTSVSLIPPGLCRFELSAVSQHGVHDDRVAPGERDPRLAHC